MAVMCGYLSGLDPVKQLQKVLMHMDLFCAAVKDWSYSQTDDSLENMRTPRPKPYWYHSPDPPPCWFVCEPSQSTFISFLLSSAENISHGWKKWRVSCSNKAQTGGNELTFPFLEGMGNPKPKYQEVIWLYFSSAATNLSSDAKLYH